MKLEAHGSAVSGKVCDTQIPQSAAFDAADPGTRPIDGPCDLDLPEAGRESSLAQFRTQVSLKAASGNGGLIDASDPVWHVWILARAPY